MSDQTPQIADRDALASLIEGLSDDEITQAVGNLGVDQVIEQVTTEMSKRFVPERAAGQSAVVQWDVMVGDETKSFHLVLSEDGCTAQIGPADSPRLTLAFTLPNFLRFIAGKLDGMQAFMSGQLKITGDVMFAQQMQAWFDQG